MFEILNAHTDTRTPARVPSYKPTYTNHNYSSSCKSFPIKRLCKSFPCSKALVTKFDFAVNKARAIMPSFKLIGLLAIHKIVKHSYHIRTCIGIAATLVM